MGKMVEYVRRGGIYVNVADVPGYYAYSVALRRRLDTTPSFYTDPTLLVELRPYARTPLMFKLGLQTLGRDSATREKAKYEPPFDRILNVGDLDVERAVVVASNVQPIIRATGWNRDDKNVQVTPFFTVAYGRGSFLMSLLRLENPTNDMMKENIAKATVFLVAEQDRRARLYPSPSPI